MKLYFHLVHNYNINCIVKVIIILVCLFNSVNTIKQPGSCSIGEYYEPSVMQCVACALNASLTTSPDGFSCTCSENSIPWSAARCRPCGVTELVAADGGACVQRRCHAAAGRLACRKCPRDYIAVTQNLDGSPLKEVQCIKCAKGFKAVDNKCVRCEACACGRGEVAVAGTCVPRKYLADRPKYTENRLHPAALMELVKLEYLCTELDVLACRSLGRACVRSLYSEDLAGPCSLWLKRNVTITGLPLLAHTVSKNDDEINLEHGKDTLKLIIVEHTTSGGIKLLENAENGYLKYFPFNIQVGKDISTDVVKNVTDVDITEYNSTYELYVSLSNELKPLPIRILKNNRQIQKGLWSSNKFRKFFLVEKYLSITTNVTEMVYLRTLLLHISISRDASKSGSLRLTLNVEAQYETKSPLAHTIITTFEVRHRMPTAGVARSLEILCGVFVCAACVYGALQWRGAVRRGALHLTVVPVMASAVADALYFATLVSTLHALAAEAGTLGLTLPLSRTEEKLIAAMIYSAVALKALKVIWINIKQCRSNILLIDWSKYNASFNEVEPPSCTDWRGVVVARAWAAVRSARRVCPGYTAALALLILHFLDIRMSYVPPSDGYRWCITSTAWWVSYSTLLLGRYTLDLAAGSPTADLPRTCAGVGVSLLVFQEDRYAHYVNGRNDATIDYKMITGSLATCRLFCSTQLREIYTKLSTAGYGEFGQDPNRVLLTRFMAAFFERALDGLNWVASERTTLERLLDVELVDREGGNTSILLYDSDTTPSCFAVTWWGEEWLLATFDAMLFDCVFITTGQPFLAALITLTTWQVGKYIRTFLWNRRIREDWNIENNFEQMKRF